MAKAIDTSLNVVLPNGSLGGQGYSESVWKGKTRLALNAVHVSAGCYSSSGVKECCSA